MTAAAPALIAPRPAAAPGRLVASWPWLAFAAILLLALTLRCWQLAENGFGNEYYSAGVRSMLESWHNLLFDAFDPAGFVTIDKPPVAFWIQAASARLLGFDGLSLLLPQAIEGTLAVALLCHLVRRRFGWGAGLAAGLFLALTPISVAVDRSTNTESCLVLVLLLAALALDGALRRGSLWRLALAMALLGIGFNVKMLEGLVVAPVFLGVYLLGAPVARRYAIAHVGMGAIVLIAVSLSWSLYFDLTPEASRPYAGSSVGNSMIELAFDHNALQRFVPRGVRRTAGGLPPAADGGGAAAGRLRQEAVEAGPLRLVQPFLAGQIGWLLPLALVGAVAAWRRRPRRLPLAATPSAVLLWSGWAASYAVVYSAAGGIFHAYYLATMAPALAALAALGLGACWRRQRTLAPAALLGSAAWQVCIVAGFPGLDIGGALALSLGVAATIGAGLAVAGLAVARSAMPTGAGPGRAMLAPASLMLGVAALLVAPVTWSLASAAAPARVAFPVVDPALPAPAATPLRAARTRQVAALLAFLEARHRGERFLVALPDARRAAPLILASGAPVMAIGGYSGGDAILTPAALADMVATRALRFVMVPRGDAARGRGNAANAALLAWVRDTGRRVDPALWQADRGSQDEPAGRRNGQSLAALDLYDLAPGEAAD